MSIEEPLIAALIKRERYFRDTAQYDECRNEYHPDKRETYINITWFEGDVDEFMNRWRARDSSQQRIDILHQIDPVYIRVSDKRAISDSFCTITRLYEHDNHEFKLTALLRILSRFVQVQGQWKMLSLEAIYIRDSVTNNLPFAPANPPVMDARATDYPKGYRNTAWMMLLGGVNPRKNLPHNDDSEGVRALVKKNRQFLEENL